MLVTPQETFLELEEAADALGMHPVTLRERATLCRLAQNKAQHS